jgi:TRAP-type C4-dicarboxylate transport system permease small subunit
MLKKLDDLWYRVERALCIGLLVVMAISVFLDAVHRQASGKGRLEQIFENLFGADAAPLASTVLAVLLTFWVVYGALRTMNVKEVMGRGKAAVVAAVSVIVLWGLVKGLVLAFPNGLIWAQSVGLSGMLWVGFLGASMATKEGNHLTLEITEIIWKGNLKKHVSRVGALAASTFCAVLAWLCWLQVQLEYHEWKDTEGATGTMMGLEAPRWAVFMVLPLAFSVMAARLFARVIVPEEEKGPQIAPIASAPPQQETR